MAPEGLNREAQYAAAVEEQTRRLTSKELGQAMTELRERGLIVRNTLYRWGQYHKLGVRWQNDVLQAAAEGTIDDREAEMPDPDKQQEMKQAGQPWVQPKIDAQEVRRRMDRDLQAQKIPATDTLQLEGFLNALNKLAEEYKLDFHLTPEIVLAWQQDKLSGGHKIGKTGEDQTIKLDERILAELDKAIKSRLWELTTPEK